MQPSRDSELGVHLWSPHFYPVCYSAVCLERAALGWHKASSSPTVEAVIAPVLFVVLSLGHLKTCHSIANFYWLNF